MDKINKIVKATVAIAAAACMAASLVNAEIYYCTANGSNHNIANNAGGAYWQYYDSAFGNQSPGASAADLTPGSTAYIGIKLNPDNSGTTLPNSGNAQLATSILFNNITLIQVGGNLGIASGNIFFGNSSTLNVQAGTMTTNAVNGTSKFQAGGNTVPAGAGFFSFEGGTINLAPVANSLWGGLTVSSVVTTGSTIQVSGTAAVTAGWIGDPGTTGEYGTYTFAGGTTTVNANMTGFSRDTTAFPFIFIFSGGTVTVSGSLDIKTPINFTLDSTAILDAAAITHGASKISTNFLGLWHLGLLTYAGHDQAWYMTNALPYDFTDYFVESSVGGKQRLSVNAIPEPTTWALLGVSLLVVTLFRRRK